MIALIEREREREREMHLHERYRTVSPYIVTNTIGGTLFCYKTINAKRHKNSSSPSVCFSFSNTFQIFILNTFSFPLLLVTDMI